MLTEFLITFIKMFIFNYCSKFTFFKIKKHYTISKNKETIILLVNILITTFYSIMYSLVEMKNVAVNNAFFYIIYILIVSIISKHGFQETFVLGIISIAITYISMFISTTVTFVFLMITSSDITVHRIVEYAIIGIMEFSVIYLFFKIKRYKNGLSFLSKKNNITSLGVFISVFLIIAFILIGKNTKDILVDTYCTIGLVTGALFMSYWLKTSITKYYKERMKDRTVELQSEQLKEKDEIITNLNQELSNVLEINHKYNKRLCAMEKAIGNFGDKLNFNEEFAKEYSEILDSLKNLSKEYKQEFENYNILPKTNIFSLDNLLDYMKTEAIRNNIEFDLEINGNINELIEKHISKSKLETLLGDHITDAIIAINARDNSNKKIKVIMGKDKEFYKISVLDTGIEFEIETLLKLGLERITTHKDSGGTGIGFMTTFETLKECKASLVIEEYNNEKDYTKSVNVIFDGKSEYNINSYRAEKINYQTRTIE